MPHLRLALVGAALIAAASTPVLAAELSAECKPILAAMEKSLRADHTTTTAHGAETMRGVTVGGTVYVQGRGAWRKSPMTVQQSIEQMRENLRDAKAFTCKALPDAVADGTPVLMYATHTVTDDGTQDSRIAVAKSTGLAVSVENRNPGEPGADMTTHYGYANVKAPM